MDCMARRYHKQTNKSHNDDPFDYPNSPLLRCKEFSDFIHDSFEYFQQNDKCGG